MKALEMRPYRPGDEVNIVDLATLCYGWNMSAAAWAWRYRDNPAGKGIIELCWDGDVLAAHYSVAPSITQIGGRDCLTALSGTTVTHPNYRGRKLFPILARRVFDRAAQLGVVVVYGFPNSFSHRGYVRDLGRRDVYEVPTFRLPVRRRDIYEVSTFRLALTDCPPPSNDNVVELTEFDERFDQLWERVRPRYSVITKRDTAYLQWRYAQNPASYWILAQLGFEEVLGYVVLKRYQGELHVIDILALNVHVGEQLIQQAVHIALRAGASALSLWLGVTQPLHWKLERMGFRNEEPVTYFGAHILQPNFVGADIFNFYNWYLMMSDSDVY